MYHKYSNEHGVIGMDRKGVFIVIEGPDGAGKTTFANALAKRLRAIYGNVLKTREPYSIRVDELKELGPDDLYKKFIEDRKVHVREIIEPALSEGKIVISDRYWPSTFVYEGIMGIPEEIILRDNEEFSQPDVAIFLLPPIEVLVKRNTKKDHLDSFALRRIEEIREKYEEVADIMKNQGIRVIVIDDENALDLIEDIVFSI